MFIIFFLDKDENKVPVINVINSTVTNVTSPRRRSDEENQSPKPKKRTKINKKKEAIVEEEDDVIPDQGRITRTKSKAAKQILEENANRKSVSFSGSRNFFSLSFEL